MIRALYAGPTTTVSTNGLHSSPFPIFRGTRQGCSLSPSLFILSLELLAQHLRENQVLVPIRIKTSLHVISAFTDDVLIYRISIRCCLFCPTTFPLNKEIMYLGIQIQPSLHNIVKMNYENIFKEVERDIAVWTKLPASLQTRIAMMIPLPPPMGYWKRVDSLRLTYAVLYWGGLGFPNFMRYHQAFQLRPLKTWLDRASQVAWRDIEDALELPYKLEGVLFSGLTINQCMLHYYYLLLRIQ
uniref:Uncharacterized protein n=1 Tax=Acanthochromis polyacanthus TaxID=80966 RepID=A0A3Q1G4G3_9TELE